MRSELNMASYNPRKISENARKRLKANLKRVGLLGGIVWNEDTGHIVSGHQRLSVMDEVNKYDPETMENDYPLRVEVVHLDEKSEKEQNLFMNNRSVQGTFDDDKLKEMLRGIDVDLAGYDELDLNLLGLTETPKVQNTDKVFSMEDFAEVHERQKQFDEAVQSEEQRDIDRSKDFYEDTEENQIARHAEVEKIKDRIRNKADTNDNGMLSYIVLSFENEQEKLHFLQMMGYSPDDRYINGKEFSDRIEFGE